MLKFFGFRPYLALVGVGVLLVGCVTFDPGQDVAMLNKDLTIEELGQTRQFRTMEQCRRGGSWGVMASVISVEKILTFDLFNRRRFVSIYRVSALKDNELVDSREVAVRSEEAAPIRLVVDRGERLGEIDFLEAEYNCGLSSARGCSCANEALGQVIEEATRSPGLTVHEGSLDDYEVRIELIE